MDLGVGTLESYVPPGQNSKDSSCAIKVNDKKVKQANIKINNSFKLFISDLLLILNRYSPLRFYEKYWVSPCFADHS